MPVLNDKTKQLMGLSTIKDTRWDGRGRSDDSPFDWLTPDNIDAAERTMLLAISKAEQAAQNFKPQGKNDLDGDDFQTLRADILGVYYGTLRSGGFPSDYIENDKKRQVQFFSDLSLKYGYGNQEILDWVGKLKKFRKGCEDRFLVALPNLKRNMNMRPTANPTPAMYEWVQKQDVNKIDSIRKKLVATRNTLLKSLNQGKIDPTKILETAVQGITLNGFPVYASKVYQRYSNEIHGEEPAKQIELLRPLVVQMDEMIKEIAAILEYKSRNP